MVELDWKMETQLIKRQCLERKGRRMSALAISSFAKELSKRVLAWKKIGKGGAASEENHFFFSFFESRETHQIYVHVRGTVSIERAHTCS